MSIDRALEQSFIRVTEQAAIAAARTMGLGDRRRSDQVAVEAMRAELDALDLHCRIVIGEGERDEAPMLYVGEELGTAKGRRDGPAVDIAVDPLEGTNLVATGAPDALAVLAAAERGGLLHAPDVYMDKIVVGPTAAGAVHIDAPVAENLRAIARALEREVSDLTIEGPHLERELLLVKVRGTGDKRVESLRIADVFRARVVDSTIESFVFELTGSTEKLNAFINLMQPLGLIDVSRTGVVAIARGPEAL